MNKLAPYWFAEVVSGSPLMTTLLERSPTSALMSMDSPCVPKVSVAAKCLNSSGSSKVMTGLLGSVVSIAAIVRYSPSRQLKLVDAMPICWLTAQSTESLRIILIIDVIVIATLSLTLSSALSSEARGDADAAVSFK